MIVLGLIGIWCVFYFGTQVILNYWLIKKSQVERQAHLDIEMQRAIRDIKSKVIKFEPKGRQ